MPDVSLPNGRWFRPETSKSWKECPGQDEVDRRIREDDDSEEMLYFTARSEFILWSCNPRYETEGRYAVLDLEAAARWLIANGYKNDLAKLEMKPEVEALEL